MIGALSGALLSFGLGASAQVPTEQGIGGVLRVLDKTTGNIRDVTLAQGQTGDLGLIDVALAECRYPADNPSGDAFGHVIVRYGREDRQVVFDGWMIASAPALNAMDHPRFDVWMLGCTRS